MRRIHTILLAATIVATATLAPVPAEAHHDDGFQEDGLWPSREREIDFTTAGGGFRYESTAPTATGEDRVIGEFDLSDTTLSTELASFEPGDETFLIIYLEFSALTEFEDLDGDGRLSIADRTVRRAVLADAPGATVTAEPRLGSDDPYRVTATIPLNGTEAGPLPVGNQQQLSGGRLLLEFVITPSPMGLDGRTLQPVDTGIQVRIEDYPFEANSTNLALELGVRSSADLAPHDGSISSTADAFEAAYRWDDVVEVDGADRPSGITWQSDPTSSSSNTVANLDSVFVIYPKGELLVDDPRVEMRRYSPPDLPAEVGELLRGDWRFYLFGVAASALLVGVPMAVRMRKS